MGAPSSNVPLPLVLAGVLASLAALGSAAKLYVVGDSLLDTGNANYYRGHKDQMVTANFPPYGMSFTPPKATGRFSNARVFTDFLAEQMGIPTPPPFKDANSTSSPYGINFAVAGAGALAVTKLSSVSMLDELQWVVSALNASAAQTSMDWSNTSLALLSIGGNDFFYYFLKNLPNAWSSGSPDIASGVVGSTVKYVQHLYDLGLRNFVVLNVAPLGCVPAVRSNLFWLNGCSNVANQAALYHNSLLDAKLDDLRTKLADARILVLDVYNTFNDAAKAAGIPVNKGACCGWPAPKNGLTQCGVGGTNLCTDPENFMFWDFVHPTDSAVKRVFDLAWSGTTQHARPYNISTLFTLMKIGPVTLPKRK